MVFGEEDKILITYPHQLKGHKATELMNEFPNKWWTKSSIDRLLKKLRDTCSVNRLTDSGSLRCSVLRKMLICLTIWFWVEKIRRRLTEQSVKS